MPNITVTVSKELYYETRIIAARRESTVTALVREFLEDIVNSPSFFMGYNSFAGTPYPPSIPSENGKL